MIHLITRGKTLKACLLSLIVPLVFMAGCATAPVMVPEPLETFDLNADCPDEARVTGIQIKATVFEGSEGTWMAIYFEPRYYNNREPMIELVAGVASYQGKKGNVYYYRTGRLPRNEYLGRIILQRPVDRAGPRNTIIEMYRRSNSRCLELREINRL